MISVARRQPQVVEVPLPRQHFACARRCPAGPLLTSAIWVVEEVLEDGHLVPHRFEMSRNLRVEGLVLADQGELQIDVLLALAIRRERLRVARDHIAAHTGLFIEHFDGEVFGHREERPRLIDEAMVSELVDPVRGERPHRNERTTMQMSTASAIRTGLCARRADSRASGVGMSTRPRLAVPRTAVSRRVRRRHARTPRDPLVAAQVATPDRMASSRSRSLLLHARGADPHPMFAPR